MDQKGNGVAPRLSARARYGFAIGDFGFNLYWQGLGLFLVLLVLIWLGVNLVKEPDTFFRVLLIGIFFYVVVLGPAVIQFVRTFMK